MCSKVNRNTKALLRIRKYITEKQASILCKSFVLAPFVYCPLIWMFCNKTAHKLIESTNRRALQAVLFDFSLSLSDLLHTTKNVSIHQKNLKTLMREVYKSLHSLNPEFMSETFKLKKKRLNLRKGQLIQLPRGNSTININSWKFRAILTWNNLPEDIKQAENLSKFEAFLQKTDILCSCRICK